MNDKAIDVEQYELPKTILVDKRAIREAYEVFVKEVGTKEDAIKDWIGSPPSHWHLIRGYII